MVRAALRHPCVLALKSHLHPGLTSLELHHPVHIHVAGVVGHLVHAFLLLFAPLAVETQAELSQALVLASALSSGNAFAFELARLFKTIHSR